MIKTMSLNEFEGWLKEGKSQQKRSNFLKLEEGEQVEMSVSDPIEVAFAGHFLKHFAAAALIAPEVKIRLGTNMPIHLTYNLGTNHGYLQFLLPPVVPE